tara:strand:+ start:352 stop:603 length:252 start_codon:yes stop_codon:yes gene_type:complete
MDDRLINEYIKNLAAEVQSLKMENILLKTRLGLLANPAQPEEAQEEEQPQPEPQEDWDEQPEAPKLKPAELGSARNEDGNFSN